MRPLSATCLLLAFSTAVNAADSRIIKAGSIELKSVADLHFGQITIRAAASDTHSLESVVVEYKTYKIEFPSEALHDLRLTDIQTIHLDAILYDPARPFLVIRLDSWDPAYRRVTGKPAVVEFQIEDNALAYRTISWEGRSGRRYTDTKNYKQQATQ